MAVNIPSIYAIEYVPYMTVLLMAVLFSFLGPRSTIEKWNGVVWIRFIWHRIETSEGPV
jgi:hypothetical protein